MQIFVQVEVFVFVGLNWEDAPPEQFAVRGVDYKVTDSFQEHDQDVFDCVLTKSCGTKS